LFPKSKAIKSSLESATSKRRWLIHDAADYPTS
jgi:hypothetical protein